jgi:hypothetical protein
MHLVIWIKDGQLAEIQKFGSDNDSVAYYRQKCRSLGLTLEQETSSPAWLMRGDNGGNAVYVCDLSATSSLRV